eukprot:gene23154-biopygen23810
MHRANAVGLGGPATLLTPCGYGLTPRTLLRHCADVQAVSEFQCRPARSGGVRGSLRSGGGGRGGGGGGSWLVFDGSAPQQICTEKPGGVRGKPLKPWGIDMGNGSTPWGWYLGTLRGVLVEYPTLRPPDGLGRGSALLKAHGGGGISGVHGDPVTINKTCTWSAPAAGTSHPPPDSAPAGFLGKTQGSLERSGKILANLETSGKSWETFGGKWRPLDILGVPCDLEKSVGTHGTSWKTLETLGKAIGNRGKLGDCAAKDGRRSYLWRCGHDRPANVPLPALLPSYSLQKSCMIPITTRDLCCWIVDLERFDAELPANSIRQITSPLAARLDAQRDEPCVLLGASMDYPGDDLGWSLCARYGGRAILAANLFKGEFALHLAAPGYWMEDLQATSTSATRVSDAGPGAAVLQW